MSYRDRDDRSSSRGRDDRGGDDRSARRDRDGNRDGARDDRDGRGGRDRDDRDSRGGRDDDRGNRGRDSRSGSGSGSGYEYRGRTKEQVEKRRTQSSQDFDKFMDDKVKMWTPKVGSNRVRILPPTWKDPEHYAYDVYVHYGVGPDRQSYLDLDKMKGEPDPIAEERAELLRSGSSKEDVYDLDSKKRACVLIIDRDDESEGVQAWAMPWSLDRDISTLSTDRDTNEILEIDNPKTGYDIEFDRRGEGIKTKYSGVSIARRSSPLGKSEWLDFAVDNPIPSLLKFYTYDEIAKAFGGGGGHRETRDDRDDDRGRDRDRSSSRNEQDDRGSDRGGSRGGRDDSRDSRGRDDSRDRDDRDGGRRGGRDSGRSVEKTWAEVHDMTGEELDAMCSDDDRLRDIKPNKYDSDADLADDICKELKIEKEAERSSRRGAADPDSGDRLRQMREERGRR